MSDKQFALQLQNINKDYRQGRSTIEVLKNINLEIYEGEFVAIIGLSGAGKSTLLRLINKLIIFIKITAL